MALVYSSVRRIDEAVAVAEKALRIASQSDNPEFSQLAPAIGLALESYRQAQKQGVNPMSGRATTRPDGDKAEDNLEDAPDGG